MPSNPFPPAAVARYSPDLTGVLTVPTQAVREIWDVANSYLSQDSGKVARGRTIAIVGEYGSGKTHLALELVRHLRSEDSEGALHVLYVDTPADSFRGLYRHGIMSKLDRSEVRRAISDYYAEVVAQELEASELTAPLAQGLRERRLEPGALVANLGLMESGLMDQLSRKLSAVTEANDFAAALTLMLRPEFEHTVWDWLSGGTPDPVLREHGIERRLDSDSDSLEAIAVLSLVLGGRGDELFVLVLDEIERILSFGSSAEDNAATLASIKRLLEIITKTGTLLVLCGLPEFLEVIPADARQRIAAVIRPSTLSADDTVRYIEDVNERVTAERTLTPFTVAAAQYLTEFASGNPRRVVRLGHRAYEIAIRTGTEVNRAIIREAARDQFETTDDAEIRREIVRVLDRNGWPFETDVPAGEGKRRQHIDYWAPHGQEDGSGCAILLTASILEGPDAKPVVRQVRAVRPEEASRPDVVVVVNGYAAEAVVNRIEQTGARVLVHDGVRFGGDLDALMKGIMHRIEAEAREIDLTSVNDRLGQLMRQTDHLAADLERGLLEAPGRMDVRLQVHAALREFFGGLSGSAAGDPLAGFPSCQGVFNSVLNMLALIQQPLTTLEGWLEVPDVTEVERLEMRYSPSELDHAGKAVVAVRLVNLFRGRIATIVAAPGRVDMRSVEIACRAHDATTELLRGARSSFGEPFDAGRNDSSHFPPGLSVGEALQELGGVVYRSLRDDLERQSRF